MPELYDKIGVGYDGTRCADPFIANKLVDLLDINPQSRIIDIACGTGNYTVALNNAGYSMTGVDISLEMLKKAQQKNHQINWLNSDVSKIPLDDAFFDGAICTLACHHFANRIAVFSEVFRLINKGKFVILTCDHEQIRNYWLYRYFPEVLEFMTSYMPSVHELIDELCSIDFRLSSIVPYYISADLQDNFLGARIEQPDLYLNESFRNGMSIFSDKADPYLVEKGCVRLRQDINTGKIHHRILLHAYSHHDRIFFSCIPGIILRDISDQCLHILNLLAINRNVIVILLEIIDLHL